MIMAMTSNSADNQTAICPHVGPSGGGRPVGHWGWNNFFLLGSVKATFVATISIWPVTPKADDYELSKRMRVVLELLTRIRVVLETNMWTRSLL